MLFSSRCTNDNHTIKVIKKFPFFGNKMSRINKTEGILERVRLQDSSK
jgi:hypothetical protein